MNADDLITALKLEPHPEGGHFRETYRDPDGGQRGHSTAIYYLLRAGEASHWHRVDAAEIWHFYAGAPLRLSISTADTKKPDHFTLGPAILKGEQPQIIVPTGAWQAARSMGEWTLVGCTVAPGFDFQGFELATPGWEPG
ncbi:MAG: cupin [Rhodobiaceae bacterium]|nr:cupin [Rhodobiaceae bacterium]